MPVPQPKIHDEFSYLLAGGYVCPRAACNPAHPLWHFFRYFSRHSAPDLCVDVSPAQGAVLAIGQLLGDPWIGVLLSAAAMCVAMTWMLQGWDAAGMALLGGVLVFLSLGFSATG